MKNKVTVTIAGRVYTLVTTDDDANMEAVAGQVDQMIASIQQQSHASALDAAVLTAVNAVDNASRQEQKALSLRTQLKDCLEESSRLKQELADTRRELTRMKNGRR